MTFSAVSIATASFFLTLAAVLLIAPDLIYWVFSLEAGESADGLARRAALLFLGLATISYLGGTLKDSTSRSAISPGIVVAMAGMALLGVLEYLRGGVGAGIGVAVMVELALVAAHARFALRR